MNLFKFYIKPPIFRHNPLALLSFPAPPPLTRDLALLPIPPPSPRSPSPDLSSGHGAPSRRVGPLLCSPSFLFPASHIPSMPLAPPALRLASPSPRASQHPCVTLEPTTEATSPSRRNPTPEPPALARSRRSLNRDLWVKRTKEKRFRLNEPNKAGAERTKFQTTVGEG
ncbi:hypothetical protein D1007_17140 [Hordeum vulgare]|nr:hypothetical protein D1007_17140 [Hordeum vulgare]